ncbi:hypothetical protein WDZ17_00115 [Pseudokineococcus basanitobsidens]|uniref:Uncharacterized protein n=1 Tax=Pseudokineococcus basanitobsidens TaxID=1926649 RepID=A0ABU8RF33_9ACTN
MTSRYRVYLESWTYQTDEGLDESCRAELVELLDDEREEERVTEFDADGRSAVDDVLGTLGWRRTGHWAVHQWHGYEYAAVTPLIATR